MNLHVPKKAGNFLTEDLLASQEEPCSFELFIYFVCLFVCFCLFVCLFVCFCLFVCLFVRLLLQRTYTMQHVWPGHDNYYW